MTLTSATTEKSARVKISAASSPTWVRAESSIPITTIAVMITIQMTPTVVTARVDSASVLRSKSSKV